VVIAEAAPLPETFVVAGNRSKRHNDSYQYNSYDDDGNEVRVRMRGDIEFSKDGDDIVAMSDDAYLKLYLEDDGDLYKLYAQPGDHGDVIMSVYVNDRELEEDAKTTSWRTAAIQFVYEMRGGTMAIEGSVPYVYGVPNVSVVPDVPAVRVPPSPRTPRSARSPRTPRATRVAPPVSSSDISRHGELQRELQRTRAMLERLTGESDLDVDIDPGIESDLKLEIQRLHELERRVGEKHRREMETHRRQVAEVQSQRDKLVEQMEYQTKLREEALQRLKKVSRKLTR